MIPCLLPRFAMSAQLLGSRNAAKAASRRWACLMVEPLEDRFLFANRLWVGPAGGNWSVQNNWADETGAAGAPQNGDSLVFNSSLTWGGKQGTDSNSTDDIAGLSIENLTITSNFNPTITFSNNLTIKGNVLFQKGTLKTDASVSTITWTGESQNNTGMSWEGGEIGMPFSAEGPSVLLTGGRKDLSGSLGSLMLGRFGGNATNTLWSAGDIWFSGDSSLWNRNGSFNIQCGNNIFAAAGSTGQLTNSGTLTKSTGGDNTIEVRVLNTAGTIEIQTAKLVFTGDYYKQLNPGSATFLNGGNIQTAPSLEINNGILKGHGTITGSVSVINPATTVDPGYPDSPFGTLTITGNYTQRDATLRIFVSHNANSTNKLSVTGTVTLQTQTGANTGTLRVTTVDNPPDTGETYDIIFYGVLVGDFATKVYDPGGNYTTTAAPSPYRLVGAPLGGGGGQALVARRGVVAVSNNPAPLSEQALRPLATEAIARWQAAGIDRATLARLNQIGVHVEDLPGADLGWASNVIIIDPDAAGYGWFVDATPGDDAEFDRSVGGTEYQSTDGVAAGRVDLLTVLMHEMGHVLGLPDLYSTESQHTLMHDDLPLGTRRLPTATFDGMSPTGLTLVVSLEEAGSVTSHQASVAEAEINAEAFVGSDPISSMAGQPSGLIALDATLLGALLVATAGNPAAPVLPGASTEAVATAETTAQASPGETGPGVFLVQTSAVSAASDVILASPAPREPLVDAIFAELVPLLDTERVSFRL